KENLRETVKSIAPPKQNKDGRHITQNNAIHRIAWPYIQPTKAKFSKLWNASTFGTFGLLPYSSGMAYGLPCDGQNARFDYSDFCKLRNRSDFIVLPLIIKFKYIVGVTLLPSSIKDFRCLSVIILITVDGLFNKISYCDWLKFPLCFSDN